MPGLLEAFGMIGGGAMEGAGKGWMEQLKADAIKEREENLLRLRAGYEKTAQEGRQKFEDEQGTKKHGRDITLQETGQAHRENLELSRQGAAANQTAAQIEASKGLQKGSQDFAEKQSLVDFDRGIKQRELEADVALDKDDQRFAQQLKEKLAVAKQAKEITDSAKTDLEKTYGFLTTTGKKKPEEAMGIILSSRHLAPPGTDRQDQSDIKIRQLYQSIYKSSIEEQSRKGMDDITPEMIKEAEKRAKDGAGWEPPKTEKSGDGRSLKDLIEKVNKGNPAPVTGQAKPQVEPSKAVATPARKPGILERGPATPIPSPFAGQAEQIKKDEELRKKLKLTPGKDLKNFILDEFGIR